MKQRFETELIARGPKGAWTFLRVPFSVEEVFGTRARVPVKGTMNGFAFQNSLMPEGDGTHQMTVSKALQEGAGAKAGDIVTVILERDLEARTVAAPAELTAILLKRKDVATAYNALSPSHQKEIADWIATAKKEETRLNRAQQSIDFILTRRRLR